MPPSVPPASTRLPAIIPPTALATTTDNLVPALIAAAWRYVEFFTANIRTPNTRRAYARGRAACSSPGATIAA